MSSRDDYPILAVVADRGGTMRPAGEAARALDELDLLRMDVTNLLTYLARVTNGDSSQVWGPDPARAATVRRTLTDSIPHFNTSNDGKT